VLDTNHPSARVLHRCGFRHEGRLRGLRRVVGTPRDFDMYARLRDDPAS
jgi:RimJ/RimL family protein N-acetyltransferase